MNRWAPIGCRPAGSVPITSAFESTLRRLQDTQPPPVTSRPTSAAQQRPSMTRALQSANSNDGFHPSSAKAAVHIFDTVIFTEPSTITSTTPDHDAVMQHHEGATLFYTTGQGQGGHSDGHGNENAAVVAHIHSDECPTFESLEERFVNAGRIHPISMFGSTGAVSGAGRTRPHLSGDPRLSLSASKKYTAADSGALAHETSVSPASVSAFSGMVTAAEAPALEAHSGSVDDETCVAVWFTDRPVPNASGAVMTSAEYLTRTEVSELIHRSFPPPVGVLQRCAPVAKPTAQSPQTDTLAHLLPVDVTSPGGRTRSVSGGSDGLTNATPLSGTDSAPAAALMAYVVAPPGGAEPIVSLERSSVEGPPPAGATWTARRLPLPLYTKPIPDDGMKLTPLDVAPVRARPLENSDAQHKSVLAAANAIAQRFAPAASAGSHASAALTLWFEALQPIAGVSPSAFPPQIVLRGIFAASLPVDGLAFDLVNTEASASVIPRRPSDPSGMSRSRRASAVRIASLSGRVAGGGGEVDTGSSAEGFGHSSRPPSQTRSRRTSFIDESTRSGALHSSSAPGPNAGHGRSVDNGGQSGRSASNGRGAGGAAGATAGQRGVSLDSLPPATPLTRANMDVFNEKQGVSAGPSRDRILGSRSRLRGARDAEHEPHKRASVAATTGGEHSYLQSASARASPRSNRPSTASQQRPSHFGIEVTPQKTGKKAPGSQRTFTNTPTEMDCCNCDSTIGAVRVSLQALAKAVMARGEATRGELESLLPTTVPKPPFKDSEGHLVIPPRPSSARRAAGTRDQVLTAAPGAACFLTGPSWVRAPPMFAQRLRVPVETIATKPHFADRLALLCADCSRELMPEAAHIETSPPRTRPQSAPPRRGPASNIPGPHVPPKKTQRLQFDGPDVASADVAVISGVHAPVPPMEVEKKPLVAYGETKTSLAREQFSRQVAPSLARPPCLESDVIDALVVTDLQDRHRSDRRTERAKHEMRLEIDRCRREHVDKTPLERELAVIDRLADNFLCDGRDGEAVSYADAPMHLTLANELYQAVTEVCGLPQPPELGETLPTPKTAGEFDFPPPAMKVDTRPPNHPDVYEALHRASGMTSRSKAYKVLGKYSRTFRELQPAERRVLVSAAGSNDIEG